MRVVTLPGMRVSTQRFVVGIAMSATLVATSAAPVVAQDSGEAGTSDESGGTVDAAETTPIVVSMGDSYISGEGGRWAGNSSGLTYDIDALGPTAYFDNDTDDAETTPRCHRSKSAAIHIDRNAAGGDPAAAVESHNLACSGAETSTAMSDGYFKPGIDFADLGGGQVGQASALQTLAAANPGQIEMIVLSIGGNDFNFSSIVKQCVTDFLKPWPFDATCSTDPTVENYVGPDMAAEIQQRIVTSIDNIETAMRNGDPDNSAWTLLVQTYPQVIPLSGDMRFPQFGYSRQADGGCGFTNADLNWAVNTALGTINQTVRNAVATVQGQPDPPAIAMMENGVAFQERALCDVHVNRLGLSAAGQGPVFPALSWTQPGAVDISEWVTEINIIDVGAWYQQESLHPNYWGQLALRNCYRQAFNGGDVVVGSCTRGTGLNDNGEPNTALAGEVVPTRPNSTPDAVVVSQPAHLEPSPGVLGNDVHHAATLQPHPQLGTAPLATPTAATSPGQRLSAELVAPTAHGTIDLAADGAFYYVPEPGFSGVDSFSYRSVDFFGESDVVTVTLEVQGTTQVPERLAFVG